MGNFAENLNLGKRFRLPLDKPKGFCRPLFYLEFVYFGGTVLTQQNLYTAI